MTGYHPITCVFCGQPIIGFLCPFCIARAIHLSEEEYPRFSKQSVLQVIQIARKEVLRTRESRFTTKKVVGILDIIAEFIKDAPL